MKLTVKEMLAAAVLALVIASPALVATLRAQTPAPAQGGIPDLIGSLRKTPGVLGVDAVQRTLNGKAVIFAWFENKKAALAWYYSDAHLALVAQFGSERTRPNGPMADVPDDGRPILAIASLTMPAPLKPGADLRASVTQIAIELYAPLPGGISVGGRFAPSTVKVQGLIEVPMSGPRPAVDGQ